MTAEPLTPCVASGHDRSDELAALLGERILVLDGATGTMLQGHELAAQDFGGEALEGCNEALNLHRPDVVLSIHRAYLAAGADIIETNTFGGTPLVLAEYGLADRAREINRVAAELARRAADESSTASRPRFVAGSMGPTTKAISVTGGVTFPELVDTFAEQARGLLEGGADLLVVETCQDTRNTKAALLAIERVLAEAGASRPIIVSGTIEPMGTMLAGQTAEAFVASVEHAPLLAIGLNCATGPDLMTDHLRAVHEWARCAVSCYPNAGLPGPDGLYPETPESLAAALDRFAANGWLNLVGGCCGTTDRHIAAIAAMAASRRPRRIPSNRPRRCVYTGIDLVEATDETRPLLVGERTNVVGSAKFRRLVAQERWDEASDIARRQVRGGAQIIDVCLQATERDERADVAAFYERLGRTVKAPLMIDSTDAAAVELALTYCQGRSIVNSINLEDGEARFAAVAPLLKRYGAAVVVGCIDEHPDQAQAFTRERKLEVALRSYELLTGRYGLADADLVFDALVFPAASGDEAYVGGAVETLEGLRMIKEALPGCRTILGVSNVSFGLPVAAREILNSVFLYHATLAGLDLAIVNTERLERFASISPEDRELAEDLLLNRPPRDVGPEESGAKLLVDAPADWRHQTPEQRTAINRLHIARLTERFRGARRSASEASVLTLDERLARYVVEGSRDGLVDDLQRKLDEGATPLEIVNGPLMRGMDEVGRLFNTNQLIVAEVLQSAESMKAAVAFLEGFMESAEVVSRGRMVLATVKGDVHDIGKNLVDIILSNNGFEVVNLGIKVPPHDLIAAVREHSPDAIGLSGLLVKSAHQMVVSVEELAAAGVSVPVLVGGAALSETFTRQRIAPAYAGPVVYCADAMKGLETMKRLAAGEVVATPALPPAQPSESNAAARPRAAGRSGLVRHDLAPVPAPYGERRVLAAIPHLREIWSYINPQMLYGKHLGLRGRYERKLRERDTTALALRDAVASIEADAERWMSVSAVWRFVAAEPDGDAIVLFDPADGTHLHRFEFPRQPIADGLCLADFVLPSRDGVRDSVALFVTTAGAGVAAHAAALRASGELLASHAVQALALETAEAAAEWLHRRLREHWGFPDTPETSMADRFAARYRGRRYSFGYPACPNLDDQAGLWPLLDPDEIGVHLTEGMMMEPEASVSALVVHHPDSSYFSVGRLD